MIRTTTAPTEPATVLPPPENRGDRNRNPPGIGLLALVREDLQTHGGDLFEQGFWAIAVHRFGNWRMGIRPKPLRAPFSVLYRCLAKWVEWTCGIFLPYTVPVGRRVRIWHFGGMILCARSIGNGVQIRQNTTFGLVRTDRRYEWPAIEDNVDIGCGVCILGPITVGQDSRIGANSVVLTDIPAGSTAVGIPAKVVRRSAIEGQPHDSTRAGSEPGATRDDAHEHLGVSPFDPSTA
jgi:serine O-acetyltransferase